MKKRSTLERQMLSYFGLIAAASLLITVEFVWALQTAMSELGMVTHASPSLDPGSAVALKVLEGLRNKAFVMCVVQIAVTLIVLIMLIRRITGPLQRMIDQAKAICDGDLSRSIKIRRRDEIGLLGETINGLTSNIQEIVALGLAADSAVRPPLERLRTHIGDHPESSEQIDKIEESLAAFRSILEGFELLSVPLAEAEADDKK
jgi:methyl-accepting chemotaxis protein